MLPSITKRGRLKVPSGFWCLDDNIIKELTSLLSVEQELSEKLVEFNKGDQADTPYKLS